jgi:ketol-acid reductoisomerase
VPVFDELHTNVVSGEESKTVLEANSAPDHKDRLRKELEEIGNSEMWRAGAAVRKLRPENRTNQQV